MKKPKCVHCGKTMKPFIPTKGKFKGKWSGYDWTCKYTPQLVLSIG